jgi:hypothetical protein
VRLIVVNSAKCQYSLPANYGDVRVHRKLRFTKTSKIGHRFDVQAA